MSAYTENSKWAREQSSFVNKVLINFVENYLGLSKGSYIIQNIERSLLDLVGVDYSFTIKSPRHTFGIALRVRRWEDGKKYDDFTLRYILSNGSTNTEYLKLQNAFKEGAIFPKYYLVIFMNEKENDYKRFRVVNLITFLQDLIDGKIKSYGEKQTGTGEWFKYFPFFTLEKYIIWRFPEPNILSINSKW